MAFTCSFITTCRFELLKGRNPATTSGATGAGDGDALIACLTKPDTTCQADTRSRWASSLAVIGHTCAASRQLHLNYYDPLFPNQDTMPNGGFGKLIAEGFPATRLQSIFG